MDEQRQRTVIVAVVGYVVLPTVVLALGLSGNVGIAFLDFSAVSVGPAVSVGVLGVLAGVVFKLAPFSVLEDADATSGTEPPPSGADVTSEGTPATGTDATADARSGSRTRTLGLVVVGVIALLAGVIASFSGAFNTYTALFWVCVPYGVAVAVASLGVPGVAGRFCPPGHNG